jgi:hypothetical protein
MSKLDLDIASLTPEERLSLLERNCGIASRRCPRCFRSFLPSVSNSIAASTISTRKGQSVSPGTRS